MSWTLQNRFGKFTDLFFFELNDFLNMFESFFFEADPRIMENLNLPYPKKIDVAVPGNMVCGVQDAWDPAI